MKTYDVYNLVSKHDGIKCAKVSTTLDIKLHTASGILSTLKHRGRVHNENGMWYAHTLTNNVLRVINKFNDIGYDDKSWCEGYVSAMVDNGLINENEFDTLIDHITNK